MLIPDRQIKQLQLLTSGKPYFESLLAAIDQAEREIHLQFISSAMILSGNGFLKSWRTPAKGEYVFISFWTPSAHMASLHGSRNG
jgi:phosphatidylserine/phosphatidylglycerophosphate/cardiolipin synthase-like enzyme